MCCAGLRGEFFKEPSCLTGLSGYFTSSSRCVTAHTRHMLSMLMTLQAGEASSVNSARSKGFEVSNQECVDLKTSAENAKDSSTDSSSPRGNSIKDAAQAVAHNLEVAADLMPLPQFPPAVQESRDSLQGSRSDISQNVDVQLKASGRLLCHHNTRVLLHHHNAHLLPYHNTRVDTCNMIRLAGVLTKAMHQKGSCCW